MVMNQLQKNISNHYVLLYLTILTNGGTITTRKRGVIMENNEKKRIINIESVVLEIKNKYDFIIIEERVFNLIITKACIAAKKSFKGSSKEEFKKILTNKLSIAIIEYIKQKIKKLGLTSVINQFIDNKFTITNDLNKNHLEFNELEQFLLEINCDLSNGDCIELLNENIKLRKIIELISINEQFPQSDTLKRLIELNRLLNFEQTYILGSSKDILENKDSYGEFTIDITKEYLKDIDKEILSKEEFESLFKRFKNGDNQAKKILIEKNLKLVVAFAKMYYNPGQSFLDLVQEGNLALIKAIEKYDINKGYAFSTYASYWIKRSIERTFANKGRNIKIPVHIYTKLSKFSKEQYILAMKLNREPTVHELSENLNLKIEEVQEFKKIQHDTVSLNLPANIEDESEIGEFIVDESIPVEQAVIISDMKAQVAKLLDTCDLTQREREILCMRYGLTGYGFRTLQSLKESFNISRARIGQIEQAAIKKLRESKRINSLAVYMDNPEQSLQFVRQYQKKK